MIATGTDVKPLECLLFMRDVKSRNYFEQMKGRGTRTLDADRPQEGHALGDDRQNALRHRRCRRRHQVAQDREPAADHQALGPAEGPCHGRHDGRARRGHRQLAGRTPRAARQAARSTRSRRASRKPQAADALRHRPRLCRRPSIPTGSRKRHAPPPRVRNRPTRSAIRLATSLWAHAANVFTGPLIDLLDSIRRDKEQTIDHDNLDKLLEAGWSGDAKENAEAMAKDFADYLEEHRDEIEALTIFYSQPARRSQVTYAMIKAVLDALKTDRPKLAPLRVWRAYALLDEYKGSDPASELTALVALIRRVCGIDAKISPYADTVRRNFQTWILKRHSGAGEKFTGEQIDWLHMIRDHIATSIHLERDDLDMAPFDCEGRAGENASALRREHGWGHQRTERGVGGMSDRRNAVLPASWAVAQLADLAEINPKLDKTLFRDDLEVSFVPMPAVEAGSGQIDVSEVRKFSEVKKGYTPFAERDVLFAKITPCMENGKMAVVPALRNNLGFGSTEFHVIRPLRDVDPRYLYYFVSSEKFRHDAEHNMTGAVGQRRVPTAYLCEHGIPVPPAREQHRITAKIDELFSELDKGLDSLTIARQQLTAYRHAVLKHAFEGKLTADWRACNPHLEAGAALRLRVLAERRRQWEKAEKRRLEQKGTLPRNDRWKDRYPQPDAFDCEDLPDLPNAWSWVGLDEIVSGTPRSMQSGPFGSNLLHSEFQASGILVIGIDNVHDGAFSMGSQNRISESKFQELEKYQARPGDLLVTVMASLGRTCIVPRNLETAIITKHVYRISMEQFLLYPEYFNLLLQSQAISRVRMFKNAQGQTRPGSNSSILKALPIPLCSREEQVEVVSRLSSILSKIEVMVSEIEHQIARSTALRQSILKKAFSGRLVAQDLKDESATVLLERIGAERKSGGNQCK